MGNNKFKAPWRRGDFVQTDIYAAGNSRVASVNEEHEDAFELTGLIIAAPALLAVAKEAYELTAKWQGMGLFDTLKTAATPSDVRELEAFEVALENAIFAAEPGYEP